MSFQRPLPDDLGLATLSAGDRRAAILREQQERAAAREERLAEQRSPLNTPEQRIRIWERLHSLSLPQNPSHSLVRVIAVQTGVAVSEVHQEQRRRAGEVDPLPTERTP